MHSSVLKSSFFALRALRLVPLAGALGLATSSFAVTVNVTDFSFPSPTSVDAIDSAGGINYSGAAGRFTGTTDDAAVVAQGVMAPAAANTPTSFVAYCAELTQSFSFATNYTDYGRTDGLSYFGAQKVTDLSRLFTAFSSSVVDAATSAAMQAGIWEVIYERGTSYSLVSGNFTLSSQDPSFARAFSSVESVLNRLSSYSAGYTIGVLASPNEQDFVFATPVPEPSTWALLVGGLAAIGAAARRRRPSR